MITIYLFDGTFALVHQVNVPGTFDEPLVKWQNRLFQQDPDDAEKYFEYVPFILDD